MNNKWLSNIINSLLISDVNTDYLLSRGCKEENIKIMGIGEWKSNNIKDFPIGDGGFLKLMGKSGKRINDTIVIPFYSPNGDIIGLESRIPNTKDIIDYRTPSASWCPVTVGMNKYLNKMMSGCKVWIVEGIFDLFAMEWVIGKNDAVLATLRANVGKNLAKFFYRFGLSVNVVYDNDKAGKDGLDISLKTLKKYGVKCSAVSYNGFKDPGEIWDFGGEQSLIDVFGKRRIL